jgi:hypothetical protein
VYPVSPDTGTLFFWDAAYDAPEMARIAAVGITTAALIFEVMIMVLRCVAG